jgi:hypothetical protein
MSSAEHANGSFPTKDNDVGTTPKDEGEKPSNANASKSYSNKRQSDVQLHKDDCDGSGDDDDDGANLNDEGGKRSDPFKRASDDVIKSRKIIKASSKWSSGSKNGGTEVGGTFASIKLTNSASPAKTGTDDATSSSLSANESNSSSGSNMNVSTSFASSSAGAESGSTTAKSGALFGSSFSNVATNGFGNVATNGFGSLKASTTSHNANSSTFGGGFGSVSSGFGSLKSSTTVTGFGSASSQPKDAATLMTSAATSSSSGPNAIDACRSQFFPTPSLVDIDNGEKDEICVCEVRAKLFRMFPEDESDVADEEGTSKGDVPSVPSTTGRMESIKTTQNCANDGSTVMAENNSTAGPGEEGKKPNLVQKEAGIGPVRILTSKPPPRALGDDGAKTHTDHQSSTSRVVQRQETSGGGATRVILNIRLDKASCTVIRRGDKFVQLNAPNSCGAVESSLFKVKSTAEADTLENTLKDMLGIHGDAI